jgi:hypothetical protein
MSERSDPDLGSEQFAESCGITCACRGAERGLAICDVEKDCPGKLPGHSLTGCPPSPAPSVTSQNSAEAVFMEPRKHRGLSPRETGAS